MKEINLREEFGLMTEKYGLTALYIRENKFIRCRCYDQLHRTGDSSCNICGGFGHLTAIESVRFIYDSNYFRNGEVENKAFGLASAESTIFYMGHKTQPRVKDRIYITKWVGNTPEEISRVYVISDIDEMRMDDGRIEAYAVSAKLRPDLLKNANDSLNALDYKAKVTLGKGGKYIWPYNNTQS